MRACAHTWVSSIFWCLCLQPLTQTTADADGTGLQLKARKKCIDLIFTYFYWLTILFVCFLFCFVTLVSRKPKFRRGLAKWVGDSPAVDAMSSVICCLLLGHQNQQQTHKQQAAN